MPPKKKSPSPDKTLTMDYKEYMQAQDEVAKALVQQHNFVSSTMMASSKALNDISNSRLALQTSVKSFFEKHGLGSEASRLKKFPSLQLLLSNDPNVILNPMHAPEFSKTTSAAEPKEKKKRKAKDPKAPKRPQTAFFLYLGARREPLTKQHPALKPGDIAKMATEEWNTMSENERQIYKDQYHGNYKIYEKAMEQYKGAVVELAAVHPADEEAEVEDEDEEEDDDTEAVVANHVAAADDSDHDEEEEEEESDDEEEEEPIQAPSPPPIKTPKGKKTPKAASAKKDAAPVQQKSPERADKSPAKGKRGAKAQSPEAAKKQQVLSAPLETPATEKKKKRKSTGPEVEERKRKRRATHGDDY